MNLFYLLCICLSVVVWRLFHDLNVTKTVEKSEDDVVPQQEFVSGEKPNPTDSSSSSASSWSLKCQVGLDLKSHGKLKESSEIFSTLSLTEFLNLNKKAKHFLPEWDECLWEIGIESKSAGDYEKTFHIFSTIYQHQKETKGENHPFALKILDELGRVVLQQKLREKEDGNSIPKLKSTVNMENQSFETDETKKASVSLSLLSRSLLWILSISKLTSWILVYILSYISWMSIPLSVLIWTVHPIQKSKMKILYSNFGYWPFIASFLFTVMALVICNIYDESLSLKNLLLALERSNGYLVSNLVKYILYFTILNSVVVLLTMIMSFPIVEALSDLFLVSFSQDIKKGVQKGQPFIYTVVQAVILFTFGFISLSAKILIKEVLHSLLLLMTIVLTVFYVLL